MVWTACGASAIQLLVVLLVFYISYFWLAGSTPPAGVDRILSLPPVLAALWAAGMGWYVHFQASAKNHRTTNSFNLLMQTRTSAEFLRHARAVQICYPHGTDVPKLDEGLIGPRAFAAAQAALLSAKANPPEAGLGDLRATYKKARAADGMKYLLNYYEFMAVGINARDLDEEMLYKTIGYTVTSQFNRARTFITYIRSPAPAGAGQALAFEHLEKLVQRWDRRLRDDIHALG